MVAKMAVQWAWNKTLGKSEEEKARAAKQAALDKAAAEGTATAAAVAGAATRVAAAGGETTADTIAAAAGLMKAYSWIPYVGMGIAVANIAVMLAQMASVRSKTAFATGGLVTEPTLALIGETGKREFVAPEIDFINWSERLSYNIIRRQNEANKYAEYNAMIIRQASEGGMRPPVTVNHYAIEDSRKAGAALNKLLNHYAAGV
jgi:hypothetical protein